LCVAKKTFFFFFFFSKKKSKKKKLFCFLISEEKREKNMRGVVTYYLSPMHQRVMQGFWKQTREHVLKTSKESMTGFVPAAVLAYGIVAWAGVEYDRIQYEHRP
jgi:UcrQ family